MKFDEVKKVGVQNLTFNTAKPKETKTPAEIDENKKFEEFSSDYSAAQRALGLSNVSFNGGLFGLKSNYKKELEELRQILENDDSTNPIIARNIIEATTKENISLARLLCEDKDFPVDQIEWVLCEATEGSAKAKKEMYHFLKKLEDFPKENICDVVTSTYKNNVHFAKTLCEDKDFPRQEIGTAIWCSEDKDIKAMQDMYYFIKENKDIQKKDIGLIISNTTKHNLKAKKEMYYFLQEIKDFPKEEINYVIAHVDEENISFAKKICLDKDFPKEAISNTIFRINKENIAFAEKVYNDENLPKEQIKDIVSRVNKENIAFAEKLYNDKTFPRELIGKVLANTYKESLPFVEMLYQDEDFPNEKIHEAIDNFDYATIKSKKEIYNFIKEINIFPKEQLVYILAEINNENIDQLKKEIAANKDTKEGINKICTLFLLKGATNENDLDNLEKSVPREVYENIITAPIQTRLMCIKLAGLYGKSNVNEISIEEKRNLVRNIVQLNVNLFEQNETIRKNFPLAPKNQEEYCTLLSSLVKSLGIEVNELTNKEIDDFNLSLDNISTSLEKMSDEEFNSLEITQEYSRESFIKDVLAKVENLEASEKQKVFDYFGFELQKDNQSSAGYTIIGYPVNLNNGKKLAQIENENTKKVVEDLRGDIIKFSKENKIKTNNKELTKYLNELASSMPEIHTMIGKQQHQTHSFDIMKHSLKVIQKISQNEKFKTLNKDDKKLILLAGLMHDICKKENSVDKSHPTESAFDSYYITKKLNLTKDEEIKLYTLIKHHDWYEHANSVAKEEKTKKLQSIAFDFQYDNLFELAEIFTEADLKSVKDTDKFFDLYGDNLGSICKEINKNIKELQKTRPMLPTTKIPNASRINEKIKVVNPDGSTNIKGVYKDKDGLIIIKYNEVENWQDAGFDNGCTSKNTKTIDGKGKPIETGNIKFIAHGVDYANQLSNFDAFALPNSDALLSVSYMERPESKYRLFRTQGVLLDVDTKYIHGGGETDSGSGCGKNIDSFKNRYIFGAERQCDRDFISNLIKEALNLDEAGYAKFLKENENKAMHEIEPAETREKLIKAFATINSRTRRGEREYNEMYVSNPKVAGVFGYSETDKVGDIMEFIKNKPEFLKKYAIENDVPFVVFGD